MERKVILSTNDNINYSFFAPITCWMWRQFGYEPILMTMGEIQDIVLKYLPKNIEIYRLKQIPGYKPETVSQVGRLYGSLLCEDTDYVLLGDIDMLPLSTVFVDRFPVEGITVMGWDITGYTEIPVCYVGMTAQKWVDIYPNLSRMHDTLEDWMQFDMAKYTYNPDDFYNWWSLDQRMLTSWLKDVIKNDIPRGSGSNGVGGRVCRSNWKFPEHPKESLIDCHAMTPGQTPANFDRNLEVIKKVTTGWEWIVDYYKEFTNEI